MSLSSRILYVLSSTRAGRIINIEGQSLAKLDTQLDTQPDTQPNTRGPTRESVLRGEAKTTRAKPNVCCCRANIGGTQHNADTTAGFLDLVHNGPIGCRTPSTYTTVCWLECFTHAVQLPSADSPSFPDVKNLKHTPAPPRQWDGPYAGLRATVVHPLKALHRAAATVVALAPLGTTVHRATTAGSVGGGLEKFGWQRSVPHEPASVWLPSVAHWCS